MTETGIRRTNDQLRSLKDQSTALEYDVSTLRTTLFNEEKEARRMKDVYELIEQFSTMKEVEMAEIQTLFLKLKADFQNEYRLFNLETVAVPLVLPLVGFGLSVKMTQFIFLLFCLLKIRNLAMKSVIMSF